MNKKGLTSQVLSHSQRTCYDVNRMMMLVLTPNPRFECRVLSAGRWVEDQLLFALCPTLASVHLFRLFT